MDGLPSGQDIDLADRGRWDSLASGRRCRRPAAYIRRLGLFTVGQKRTAQDAPAVLTEALPRVLRS